MRFLRSRSWRIRGSRRFTIVRPTIVLGHGSATLAGLETLARLPVVPVFGNGRALVQPIFVDDVVDFIATVVEQDRFCNETLELGGPSVLTIEELLGAIRRARTGTAARVVHIPLGLVLPPLKAAESIGLAGLDRKSTRLNSSHLKLSRMPSSA